MACFSPFARALALLALAAGSSSCGDPGLAICGSTLQPCCGGNDCSAGLFCSGGVCVAPGKSPVELRYRTKVDVLFLIDDSPSMEAMAAELRSRFSQFFAVFTELARMSFYADLHLGVVTSDYGAGANGSPGCARAGGGRGARFQTVGRTAPAGCLPPAGADYIQYVFAPSGDGPNDLPPGQDLIKTFTCMASVGAGGCGMEHSLESVYQALKSPPPGFLRADALLTVVFVTNEDDCSAPPESDLFDESKTAEYGFFSSFRCSRFGVVAGNPPALLRYADSGGPMTGALPAPNPGGVGPGRLFDIGRYRDFFVLPAAQGGLKDDPSDVVLVGIDAPVAPAQVLLADPTTPGGSPYVPCNPLNDRARPACAPVLQHSCVNPKKSQFFGDPAIRLNHVITAARHHAVASICDDDYSGAMQRVGEEIASQLGLGCIGASLPADPQRPGAVLADCDVSDVAQAGGATGSFTIPKCATPPTSFPCWRIEAKAACAERSPQGLGMTIDRNGAPTPPSANIRAACTTLK